MRSSDKRHNDSLALGRIILTECGRAYPSFGQRSCVATTKPGVGRYI